MSQHHPPSKCRFNGRGGGSGGKTPCYCVTCCNICPKFTMKYCPWLIEIQGQIDYSSIFNPFVLISIHSSLSHIEYALSNVNQHFPASNGQLKPQQVLPLPVPTVLLPAHNSPPKRQISDKESSLQDWHKLIPVGPNPVVLTASSVTLKSAWFSFG